MWHEVDGMGWWMLWGGIMMVLFWGLMVGLAVWGIQSLTKGQTERQDTGSRSDRGKPLDIAKERYASGEIDSEQFDEIRDRLEGS